MWEVKELSHMLFRNILWWFQYCSQTIHKSFCAKQFFQVQTTNNECPSSSIKTQIHIRLLKYDAYFQPFSYSMCGESESALSANCVCTYTWNLTSILSCTQCACTQFQEQTAGRKYILRYINTMRTDKNTHKMSHFRWNAMN